MNSQMQQSQVTVNDDQTPEQFVNAFITSISENRQAFDIFKGHAQKKGIMQGSKPLMHSQQEYYEKFISHK